MIVKHNARAMTIIARTAGHRLLRAAVQGAPWWLPWATPAEKFPGSPQHLKQRGSLNKVSKGLAESPFRTALLPCPPWTAPQPLWRLYASKVARIKHNFVHVNLLTNGWVGSQERKKGAMLASDITGRYEANEGNWGRSPAALAVAIVLRGET
jgi:hypothetical protein